MANSSFHVYYHPESAATSPARHRLTSVGDDTSSPGVNIDYVAEGAANVIWSLSTDPAVRNKLLRLRKGTWADVGNDPPAKGRPPPFLSSSQVLEFYSSQVRPLFEESQLVEQELVHVDAGVIAKCNAHLDELERASARPVARHRWHIQHDEYYGLLVTSMLPTSQKSALFHFKPKWLAQSPTAPPNARRCRTCALAARRDTAVDRLICPLALFSGDKKIVRQQIEARIRGEAQMSKDMIGRRPSITMEGTSSSASEVLRADVTEHLIEDFTGLFLPGQPAYRLLERLKDLQLQFDPKGVLAFDPTANTTDISMAMTLRDATMFVKLTPSGANVRLGDLDPKSGDSARKVEHWRGTEESLIKEGWYEGTESESLKKGWGTHTSCSLWRS